MKKEILGKKEFKKKSKPFSLNTKFFMRTTIVTTDIDYIQGTYYDWSSPKDSMA